MQDESELDPQNKELVDRAADFVIQHEMQVYVVMMVESTRPLHGLGSHLLLFLAPFLTIIFSEEKINRFQTALQDHRYVDYFLTRLEKS